MCRCFWQIDPKFLENVADVEVNSRHLMNLLNEVVSSIIQANSSYPESVPFKELGLILIIIILYIIQLEGQRRPEMWTQLKPQVVKISRDRSAAN